MKIWRLIIVSACATAGLISMALERNWADVLWPVLATAFYWAYCVQRDRAESAERDVHANQGSDHDHS